MRISLKINKNWKITNHSRETFSPQPTAGAIYRQNRIHSTAVGPSICQTFGRSLSWKRVRFLVAPKRKCECRNHFDVFLFVTVKDDGLVGKGSYFYSVFLWEILSFSRFIAREPVVLCGEIGLVEELNWWVNCVVENSVGKTSGSPEYLHMWKRTDVDRLCVLVLFVFFLANPYRRSRPSVGPFGLRHCQADPEWT